jgi:hypothetical protein
VVYSGGGTPKNFVQQTEVTAAFMRNSTKGHKHAMQIVTNARHWGIGARIAASAHFSPGSEGPKELPDRPFTSLHYFLDNINAMGYDSSVRSRRLAPGTERVDPWQAGG